MSDVLSNEALEDLERKRQAATPGTWEVGIYEQVQTDDGEMVLPSVEGDEDNGGIISTANKQWVAAANPETVGKLIAEVRMLRRVPPGALLVKGPASDKAREALAEGLRRLRSSSDWGRVVIAPEPDEVEGLYAAAEFFEAMDASGDREPLTPSAIACLLREYAADRRKRATGVSAPPLACSYVRPGVYDGEVSQFPDGKTLTMGSGEESGRAAFPPEPLWPDFFDRIWEEDVGVVGSKGGLTFLLKPKEKP